ncbi:hypothetical protein Pcinc_041648 [Petrolisthes cinctipes]|uniref:Prokineticin domain-containing protein n=1 Tax=Petrolisthes cinctipes TaxID=88211 RepID=A0AAE1BJQ5_PETCI|nr:hypothetical protein Pcinc_041648 [Petrolisthes cinctipes]
MGKNSEKKGLHIVVECNKFYYFNSSKMWCRVIVMVMMVMKVMVTTTTTATDTSDIVGDCSTNAHCGPSFCCRVGRNRYSVPTCSPLGDIGDYCSLSHYNSRPFTLHYPGGIKAEVAEGHLGLCPCEVGLSCSKSTSTCQPSRPSTSPLDQHHHLTAETLSSPPHNTPNNIPSQPSPSPPHTPSYLPPQTAPSSSPPRIPLFAAHPNVKQTPHHTHNYLPLFPNFQPGYYYSRENSDESNGSSNSVY